jgi:hypothetical protein
METCRLCQAIGTDVKVHGRLCVIVDIDDILVATSRIHSISCEYEMISEAVDMLRSMNVSGALVEYTKDVGHYGISFIPYEGVAGRSQTRG